MEKIVVYSTHQSTRLTYVLDWLITERLQLSYQLTNNEQDAIDAPFCITYGTILPGKISIPDAGLTTKNSITSLATADAGIHGNKGLEECTPAIGDWNGLPVLFAGTENHTLPFDILSAIFYLLSRYEEYFPQNTDRHGRYPATDSILYKQGWLTRPIVDEWVEAFRQLLETNWSVTIAKPAFTFQPTYDIDMAYSHAYKGIKRIVGAYIRALLKGDVQQISERTQVLKKKAVDPYDSFTWLRHLHEEHGYKPIYFVLSALRTTPFDKNIHPKHPAMVRVIKQLAKEGEVGIHPSYYATHYDVMAKEQNTLKKIIAHPIHISRQHYIRLMIPTTYHLLMDNEITQDYSMGYGSHIGFRAGTGSSFLWYDLLKESVTPIRTHPFCFMDTTAHFDMAMSVTDAFAALNKMVADLQRCGSTLNTVFHNFSLGTDQQWHGWNSAYATFLAKMAK